MRPLGPFWPKYNETKKGPRGQSTISQGQVGPKPQVGHLSQFWPQSQQSQKWPKGPQDPNWPLPTPEATSSGPERSPLNSGEDLSFTNLLHTKGSRCGAYVV
ncbi:hypothetical protein O181_087376 [Austropuccinia psidii MF-1]|uniref:Uncharacterized protein n=1 Tax=Austropuccinia psidii MF-1 TaxID=1389203 RepID=A0A9Q3IPI9_9BASI|nr:hypothetical protein [Austropuccinia psidii MF-1]